MARPQSVRELLDEIEALELADAFRGERSSLFGYMCNHFCEEHAALQEFLAERAPGITPEPPEPDERIVGVVSERVTLAFEPFRRSLVPAQPAAEVALDPFRRSLVPAQSAAELPVAASAAEAVESSELDPRSRRGLIALSIAAAAAFGVIVAQPAPEPPPSAPSPSAAASLAEAPPRGASATPALVGEDADADGDSSQTTPGAPVLDERWTARRARLRQPSAEGSPR
jgi:hypothetical protein